MFVAALVLSALTARATSYEDTFDTDQGRWSGGTVAGGVLAVTDGEARLDLGELSRFEAHLSLRMATGQRLDLSVGAADLAFDYTADGGISLDGPLDPFPADQLEWVPDPEPVIEPGADYWDGGNTLHCEVFFDDATRTWFLYWTGEMASGYPYRQIGVATSPDGVTGTKYAGNPVLTIDYDKTTVDGIHVHMPTVVKDIAGTWHMFYACYQDSVGNRICHATSPDGFDWTPQGVALELGAEGEFDSGSLREPDVYIGEAGTWHMLDNGTDPVQHYGPTGYATSNDEGWTWVKHGAITADEHRLQGGSMFRSPYGVEQWWNCEDVFCHSVADPSDLSVWDDDRDVALDKGFADWSVGYVQAPSVWLVGRTWQMWFNAYDYAPTDSHERIGHARTQPAPGAWMELDLSWDGVTLSASVNGGRALTESLDRADGLRLAASGTAELDEIAITYEARPSDTGDPDTGNAGTGGDDTAVAGTSVADTAGGGPLAQGAAGPGCGGCGGGSATWLMWLLLPAVHRRRRAVSEAPLTQEGPPWRTNTPVRPG